MIFIIDQQVLPRYYQDMSIKKIKQKTIVEQVMSNIKNLIASGAYKPGDKIPTEHALAELFGVGRSSIREAIKIFNYLGVLESRAAIGTFVRERSSISIEALTWSMLLGEDELNEMIDLRGSIEVWAMFKLTDEIAAQSPLGSEIVEKLQNIVKSMEISSLKSDRTALVEADFQFHKSIITGCRNELFSSIFETLKSFLYDEIDKSQMDYKDLSKIPSEHKDLIGALLSGDKAVVYSTYSNHIVNIKKRLANY